MPKFLVNLKDGVDLRKLKKDDVLLFDNVSQSFYVLSAEAFFKKYEAKLNDLKNKYDGDNKEMRQEIKNLRRDYNQFATQIKDSNAKLIEMVESFLEKKEK